MRGCSRPGRASASLAAGRREGSDYRFSCGTVPLAGSERRPARGLTSTMLCRGGTGEHREGTCPWGCCSGPQPATEQGTLLRGQLPFFLWGGARAQFRQALDAQLPGLSWGAPEGLRRARGPTMRDAYPGDSGIGRGCEWLAWRFWAAPALSTFPHISFTDHSGPATLVHDVGLHRVLPGSVGFGLGDSCASGRPAHLLHRPRRICYSCP